MLHGMGGAGKTALADRVVRAAERAGITTWWVAASERADLRASMLAIAADLGAEPLEVKAAREGLRAGSDLVWQHLDSAPRPWLIVFDQADDPRVLADGNWLRTSTAGTVLVTTRRVNSVVWDDSVLHPLGMLPLEDAADVLLDLAPDGGSTDDARALAQRLGRLPLALTLVGSHLGGQILEAVTMRDFQDRLRANASSQIDQGVGATPAERDARQMISLTWQIALDALTSQGIPEATVVLRLLSCWGPEPVPLALLEQLPQAAVAPDGRPQLTRQQTNIALGALRDNSLVALHALPGSAIRCVRAHGLVLESIHADIPDDDRTAYLLLAGDLLDAAVSHADHQTDPRRMRLLTPHVNALLRQADHDSSASAAQLGTTVARHIHNLGDYRAAAALTELAADTAEHHHGTDHHESLAARHQQADSLHRLGKLQEAEHLFRQVYERRERAHGRRHADTLATAAALSVPLFLLGRTGESLAMMRRAIEGQKRALGHFDDETLKSQALNLEFLAHADQTDEFLHEGPAVITACEQHLGTDHAVTVTAYSNYAYGLLHAGTPQAARTAAERALAARLQLHGTDHPLTYSAKLVLSWALMLCGEHQPAIAFMQEAVTGRERLLGPDHHLTVKARILYAERLAAGGHRDEARLLLDGNLSRAEESYGADDRDVRRAADVYHHL